MYEDYVPKNGAKGNLWSTILGYAIYLLFWLALTATGLWLVFQTRDLAVELMINAELNPWAVRGFDRWIIFLLGLIWFIALIWMEHYLRTGIDKKRLWRNIATLATVQAVIAAIVIGTRFLLYL